MKIHEIAFEDLCIEESRQRKNLSAESILELASSITQVGLIHPVVVRRDSEEQIVLVAGERRLRAMEYIWNFGQTVRCGEYEFPANVVPCLYLGELDPVEAFEIELEENIRRQDLSWQDRARAVARLAGLRAEIDGEAPSPAKLAEDVGLSVAADGGGGSAATAVRQDLILARVIDLDPEIARAASRTEAFKILKRKEDLAQSARLGRAIGDELKSQHRLVRGDCRKVISTLQPESFDVILTDPPYGIDAQDFHDSGGVGGSSGGHFYDDSPDAWAELMTALAPELFRVAKPQAHLYMFCDVENFLDLRAHVERVGWKPFRTPIIYVNPSAMRAPWPQAGPQRKWQMVLYANKGNRPVTSLRPDVISCPPDPNLNHPAQKPVALLVDLLSRSVRPGDTVLDPFAGTGSIFPAAHGLKCRATGIEIDEAACGIAARRLEALR